MCFANLCESAVPLRVGGDLLGFLQTGEVMLRKPTRSQFSNIAQFLTDLATKGELKEAEKTWFQTKVLSHKQYESVLRLLEIFALHLGMVANQLVIQRDHAEPPSITRARQFIADHRSEELTLATVAKAVNMSSYYFCKTFKKVSGLNFTDYLARVLRRIRRRLLRLLGLLEQFSQIRKNTTPLPRSEFDPSLFHNPRHHFLADRRAPESLA